MLAGETAAGVHPHARSRRSTRSSAKPRAEPDFGTPTIDREPARRPRAGPVRGGGDHWPTAAMPSAIVAVTRGGDTARRLSSLRPKAPIVAATERQDTARRLTLYWGVVPLDDGNRRQPRRSERPDRARRWSSAGSLRPARRLSSSASAPISRRSDANYLKIQRL